MSSETEPYPATAGTQTDPLHLAAFEELQQRIVETDALYRIADAISRASGLDELLDEAVETLIAATEADRAAALLYDDADVLRFRAWRGLSDTYRAATDGHSPWAPETVDAEPVLVADLAEAGFDDELERAVRAEGIAALAFIPIAHGGRLVGKFMLYRDRPHVWSEREVRLCQTIAHHLASVTVRTQAQEALRASTEQLATILRTVAEGILVQSPDGHVVYANEAAARLIGLESPEQLMGLERTEMLRPFTLVDADGGPLPAEELPAGYAFRGIASERIVGYRVGGREPEQWSVVRANPVYGPDGRVELAVSVFYDITAARAAERQARESLALVDGIFRTVPVGLAFWDTGLRYVRVNAALEQINGVRAEELLGRTAFEVRPEYGDELTPVLRRVLESGEAVLDREVVGERANRPGEPRTWLTSFFPVRDPEGGLLGVGAVAVDITDERRADERARFLARASELLNETLDFEQTLGAVAELAVPAFAGYLVVDLLDEDGALRCVAAAHVDPAKTELVRGLRQAYPPVLETHPVQVALATGLPQFLGDLQSHVGDMAQDERHAEAIREIDNTSGIVVPLVARGRTLGAISLGTVPPQPPFGDDDLELAAELARRASLALDNAGLYREAQERAHAAEALEFVDDGVVLVDGEGIVRHWNPAAAKTFRVRPKRAIGRPLRELIAGWEAVREQIPLAREPGAHAAHAQTIPLAVHGEERWLSISGVRFPGGTVYAFRDLTEEHAVDQLKTDFVSTVSHELRTPLAAIYGAALTLQRDDVRLEDSQRQGLLDVISSEADRLARIVNDILWASRLDSGQMGLAIERCDAAAISRRAAGALAAHTPPAVAIEVQAPEEAPAVAADPDKLLQVLTNLLDNAVKYSPEGGRVVLAVAQSGSRIRFSVSDEGLGIPPAEHERIFEKFFRLDPNLTRGVGGTGLGLYICRELVQRMHGRIWVVSDGRRGSTFHVELPIAT